MKEDIELDTSFISITSSNMKEFLNAIISDPTFCKYDCVECPLDSACTNFKDSPSLLREEAIKVFLQLFSIEELLFELFL